MRSAIQTVLAIVILAGGAVGLTFFISFREENRVHGEAAAWSSKILNKDNDVKNLSPLPDEFPGLPTPPSSSSLESEQKNLSAKYKIDKYFNIIPATENAERKVALITINDGPVGSSTLDPILETLAQYKVHALFFPVGSKASANPTLMKKIIDQGHSVGNHSYSSSNMKNMKESAVKNEIDRANTILEKYLGTTPIFFRPPLGSYNNAVMSYITEKKMIFLNWSLGGEDWLTKYNKPETFTDHILSGLAPGSVILLKEHTITRDALASIIVGINNRGYTLIDPKDIISQ